MNAEQIIERLRVLFGIPADDNTHDEELQALFDTALAAARSYTNRWLHPVARFQETYQATASRCGCAQQCAAVASEVPVTEVEAALRDGAALDPASVVVLNSGVMLEKNGGQLFPLSFSTLDVTYKAGYAELPADLGEALCQIAAAAGGASVTAAGGTPSPAAVKKRTVFDVGAIEYADAGGSFYSNDVAVTPSAMNAIVGPWATILDAYRDLSKSLGGDDCVQTLARLPDAVTA